MENKWLICCNCRQTFNTEHNADLKVGDPCPTCTPEDEPQMGGELLGWNSDIYINVYLCDQMYGGGEEGGWWYMAGWPVESRLCHSMSDAQAELDKLTQVYNKENKGRRPISSVLSQGEYQVRLEPRFAEPWPQQRPHYE